MPLRHKKLVLSRFFDKNVELIANMCSLCYEQCADVRILSVNLDFLKLTADFESIDFKFLNMSNCPATCEEKGFSKEEIDASFTYAEKINRIINVEEEAVAKFKQDVAVAINNDLSFHGFSEEDIRQSDQNYKKVCEQNICKRVSLRAMHNTYGRRSSSSRGLRKNVKEAKIDSKRSKYFKIELNSDKDHSKDSPVPIKDYSKLVDVKVEKCIHPINDLDVKTEADAINFESEYFTLLHSNRFALDSKTVKREAYLEPKKECFGETKMPTWVPPRSPHNLIEEVLYHDPWALLVATIFLNRTSCRCARPYVFWFLKDNPDPFTVLQKYPGEFEKYFVNLGLQKTRSVQVWRMSHDFVHKDWNNVKELYGIGEYGRDAFRMFCLGDFGVEPKDRFLRIYKAWYEKVERKTDPL